MKKNVSQVRLKKIPLEPLIDTLMDLYMGGVDYVDITGISHPTNDTIHIIVRDDYINEEEEEHYEELHTEFPLSDETLNSLII